MVSFADFFYSALADPMTGFYVLSLLLGYRDIVDVSSFCCWWTRPTKKQLRHLQNPAIERIIELERGETSLNHGEFFHARLQAIQEAASICTHIIPSYAPFRSRRSPDIQNKALRVTWQHIRAFLVEHVFTGGEQTFTCSE
jgi:hypothetical protein